MRTQNRPFRLTTALAVASLLLAQAMQQPVLAQGAPPPPPVGASPDQLAGDPPERVGRVARINGTVSFRTQDENQWNPATLNYPVTAGNAFWTEPNAQAEIEVSASRFAMAPGTELDVAALTDTDFQAIEPQGEVYVRLRPAAPDETWSVQTPRGLVSLTAPGRYTVAAGDTQSPTLVTVLEGAARVTGAGVELDVGPNQTASVTGTDAFQGDIGPAQRDAFLVAMLDTERPPPAPAVAPPPIVATMPGGADLTQYGAWEASPDYGEVWYPQVAPDWVPYRDGSWSYVAPWGWTWVDAAPWGFAPFHYGRWAQVRGRWGWIPGRPFGPHPRPVYAPALVTFLGVAAVAGVGVGAALAAGRVGWVPLGPREPFHPWYRASDRYFRQVNVTHVTNVTTINRNVTINNFANRGAATVVPTSAMTASRPVGRSFQRVDPAVLAQARPVIGQQPLRPAPTTAGVTPAVARQLNLPPAGPGARPSAPGPTIRPMPAVATPGFTGGHPRQAPALHNPTQLNAPSVGVNRPITGTPPLGVPGSHPGPAPTPSALTTPGGAPPGAGGVLHGPTPSVAAPGATPSLRPPGGTGHPPDRGQTLTTTPGAIPRTPSGTLGGGQPPAATLGAPVLRPPGGTGPSGQQPSRLQPMTSAPGATLQSPPGTMSARPPGLSQPGTPMASPFHATPSVGAPPQRAYNPPPTVGAPQVQTPSPGAVQPSATFRPTPPAAMPQVHAPAPGAIQTPPPAPAVHAPPQQVVTPQMRMPPPQVVRPPPTPTPMPVARPQVPPPAVTHTPPPQPLQHSAPPASNNPHKRPGEP